MPFISRISLIAALAIVVTGCGGAGGSATPTSPTITPATAPPVAAPPVATPTPTPPPTAAPPVTPVGPYTFNFAEGTSTSDEQIIRDGVHTAHTLLQTLFGRTVEQSVTITGALTAQGCNQGGAAALTGPRTITFCMGNPGWLQPGPINRQKIAIHETFHVWQFEMRWLGSPQGGAAHWLIEGAAEYFGFRGLDSRGIWSFDQALGCMAKEVGDFAQQRPPGLGNLNGFETPQSFGTPGPLYALSMMAVDQLVKSDGVGALRTYGLAIASGTPFATAFQTTFNRSSTDFYAQFATHRTGVTPPPAYLCGG